MEMSKDLQRLIAETVAKSIESSMKVHSEALEGLEKKISGNLDIFLHEGDSEDVKTSYAKPKVDPFNAPRFQQVWIFFAMGVIVKT